MTRSGKIAHVGARIGILLLTNFIATYTHVLSRHHNRIAI